MKLIIHRATDTMRQNLGVLELIYCNVPVLTLAKLELPFLENQINISSVKKGTYKVEKYQSPTKGEVLLLKNVDGRSYIEIHSGNFYDDINGCILVGFGFKDLDKDGIQDVTESRKALDLLLSMLPNKIDLLIK